MGMFKDLKDINKMAKEMGGQRPSMKEGLAQAKGALADVQQMQGNQARLMQTGLEGRAVVKQLRDTGTMVNNMPTLELDLEVSVAGREPYPVAHRQVVSHASLGGLQPGATVAVKVDPDDPATLILV